MTHRDYRITIQDFINNNGFSGKHFVEHIKHLESYTKTNPSIEFDLYRHKIVIKNTETKKSVIVRPHAIGHSNRYATIMRRDTELVTFRYDVDPKIALQLVLNYL